MPQEAPPENRVLIVDPDPLFGRILRTKLEKLGYGVEITTTASAAMERMRADVYRIVITEIDLPDSDGPDLTRRVRELDRPHYTYLFVCSARKDKDALMRVLEAGADDYIQKPLDSLEFRLRLKNAERMLSLDDEVHFGGGTDRETGLLNRNAFLQFFRAIVSECRRAKTQGILLFVEIVNYGDIYRNNGFEAAQRVQLTLAKRLSAALRTSDIFARVGDGEFCLLLQDHTPEQCCSIAGIVLGRMGKEGVAYEDVLLDADVRISLTSFPQLEASAEDILNYGERTVCPVPAFASSGAKAR
ncbi:MAG: response regulator [Alphaproteobacteria bacterium]|nr:response regulator [Alphaproteobacteria bacterium]